MNSLKVSELRNPIFVRIGIMSIVDKMNTLEFNKFNSICQKLLKLPEIETSRESTMSMINKINNSTLVQIAKGIE